MIITELAGGYGNLVTLENGVVRKEFKENQFTKVSPATRKKREEISLRYFAKSGIVPQLLGSDETTLWMEFIDGQNSLERAKQGEPVSEEAGFMLSQIHQRINRPDRYLRQEFERKFSFAQWRGSELFKYLGLDARVLPNWDRVLDSGTTRIHGDYWLANIIGGRVIDWEFGRIGTPYQDFAAMELWTFSEYGGRKEFWQGYGRDVCQDSVNAFVKYECLDYLGDVSVEDFKAEEGDGFYHHKAQLITQL